MTMVSVPKDFGIDLLVSAMRESAMAITVTPCPDGQLKILFDAGNNRLISGKLEVAKLQGFVQNLLAASLNATTAAPGIADTLFDKNVQRLAEALGKAVPQ